MDIYRISSATYGNQWRRLGENWYITKEKKQKYSVMGQTCRLAIEYAIHYTKDLPKLF